MDLNLQDLGGGAVAEKFTDEMEKVIANIIDPNTAAKAVRTLTMTIKLKPSVDDRENPEMEIIVSSKLAPTKTLISRLAVGGDPITGEVNAMEVLQPVQKNLFPNSEEESADNIFKMQKKEQNG